MRAAETPGVDGSFSISSRRLKKGILFELTGELDMATAAVVEEELRRAESSESLIVLDLHAVSFIDSTGLRTVIGADRRLRELGGSLRIVRVPPQVQKLFKLVGITQHLTIDERLDESALDEPALDESATQPDT